MMFSQSMNLPFHPTELQVNPIQININNPPYMPQAMNIPPELEPYVGNTSAMLADEIQSKAIANNTNFIRIFMFNQCAANGFATEAFDALLQSTMDYVVYLLSDPVSIPNASIENAIRHAVPAMVYMMAANNCREYPALGNEVPRELVGQIKKLINDYDFIAGDIENMRNGGSKSRNAAMGNRTGFGGNAGNNNGNRGSFGGGGNNNGNRSFGGFGGGNNNARSTGFNKPAVAARTSHSSALFSNTGTNASNGFGGKVAQVQTKTTTNSLAPKRQEETAGSGKYPQPAFKKGTTEMAQQAYVPPEVTNYMDETWVPSQRYPYFPAYCPTKTTLSYRIEEGGFTTPILKEIDPSMEYDRHAAPSVFGKINEAIDLSKTAQNLARIQKGTIIIGGEDQLVAKAIENNEELPQLVYSAPGHFIATSTTEAWLNLMLKRKASPEKPDIYRGNATITTPILVSAGEEAVVKSLSNCLTYVGLREQMLGSQTRMSGELYQALNKRLTDIAVRSVRHELGIPVLAISDFANDIVDLMDELENAYGKAVLAAFRSRQEDHIKEATAMMPDDQFAEISDAFLGTLDFGDKKPKIIGLYEDVSMTLLNCDARDLEIELGVGGIGSAIVEELLPEVHQLVTGIFKTAHAAKQHRHFVRTNDGRVMEAVRGALGDDHYLLALVE